MGWQLLKKEDVKMSKSITVHMNEVPIYDIKIERDFSKLAEYFALLGVKGRKICIVTDSNVGSLYAQAVKEELEKTDNKVFVYTFEAGESNKTLETVQNVYEFLILNHFDRNDMLAALGGGVVGDLTGYTAATYLRGIDFIQIPTSLLAQVDSSIGGKTGVDFRAYKNMVGAFHQPKLVYMNISVLGSLSTRLFNSGFGEIIKHGLIKDLAYYRWLKENTEAIRSLDYDALEHMIEVSCNIKRNVVENDPKEKGERALLNFGHTLGHAIEKLMDFKLYHGECVVLGMIAALEISKNRGILTAQECEAAYEMFEMYEFPMTVSGISVDDIIQTSKSDKKMDANVIKFILLDKPGNAYIDRTVTEDEMKKALEAVVR